MRTRIFVGAILIAVISGLLLLDWHLEQLGWPGLEAEANGEPVSIRALPLAGLMLVLIAAGYLELSALSAGAGVTISRFGGMVCAMMVGTLPFWAQHLLAGPHASFLALLVVAGAVMVVFAEQIVRRRLPGAIAGIGGSLLAVCYLGVGAAVVLSIRLQYGVQAFVLFLIAVKFTDIGAYFTGSALGRHKLIAWLSPGKTWEGLFGGLALAAIAAGAFAAAVNTVLEPGGAAKIGIWAAAGFAVVVGLFGQGADLCESMLKRSADLKDAGRSVPGFGGVLDVVDSLLLSAPAGYVLLALLR